jgi:hypothetical protein
VWIALVAVGLALCALPKQVDEPLAFFALGFRTVLAGGGERLRVLPATGLRYSWVGHKRRGDPQDHR